MSIHQFSCIGTFVISTSEYLRKLRAVEQLALPSKQKSAVEVKVQACKHQREDGACVPWVNLALAEIRRLSCNSSPQLQFVASVEIRRLS